MAKSTKTGPLAGIRVIEMAGIGPGPFAAMLLADMGADVIRIDRPGGVDPWTKRVVRRGRPTLTADLKKPEDVERVAGLIAKADALIEGYRPGVMERLGLGPEPMLLRNPRLVYGRMTGWGQTGPLALAAGHDITYIAITGALAAIGPPERPSIPLNIIGDLGGGSLYLVTGILAGIISARATGKGQVVDTAICDGTASLMAMQFDLLDQGRLIDARARNHLDGGAPFYSVYECADGEYLAIGPLEPAFFKKLCELTGIEVLEESQRQDPKNWPALRQKLTELFKQRSREAWCQLLEGTDACVAPVLNHADAPSHPHLKARGSYVDIDGAIHPAPAPRFSATPSHLDPEADAVVSFEAAEAVWK